MLQGAMDLAVVVASRLLTGTATDWFLFELSAEQRSNWESFEDALKARFIGEISFKMKLEMLSM